MVKLLTVDARVQKAISVSYTAGGMTISLLHHAEGENISYSTTATEDVEVRGFNSSFICILI